MDYNVEELSKMISMIDAEKRPSRKWDKSTAQKFMNMGEYDKAIEILRENSDLFDKSEFPIAYSDGKLATYRNFMEVAAVARRVNGGITDIVGHDGNCLLYGV